jgi:hypothetical protein
MNDKCNCEKKKESADLHENKLFCIIGVLIVIAFGVQVLFKCCLGISLNSFDLGSYYGGVIGGIATLLALLLTIQHNKKEQEEKEEKEKEKIVQKSAIIVFYDFKFAFDDITIFLTHLLDKKSTHKPFLKDNSLNTTAYLEHIDCLTQFYFDKKWIKTVAELNGRIDSHEEDIGIIYEIYGHLMTINKSLQIDKKTLTKKEKKICSNAFESMNTLFSYKKCEDGDVKVRLNKDIYKLMDTLQKLGKIEKCY